MGEEERICRLKDVIEEHFPGLRHVSWDIASNNDRRYNCIGFALGDESKWWWPVGVEPGYWPQGAERKETMAAFVQAFSTLGYEPCNEEQLETGFQKVALFVDGRGVPKHAARQLADGQWASKLGGSWDIVHPLHAIEGKDYGTVVQILRRSCSID